MSSELALVGGPLPRLITDAGTPAAKRFLDFFTARIPNGNTRAAYVLGPTSFGSLGPKVFGTVVLSVFGWRGRSWGREVDVRVRVVMCRWAGNEWWRSLMRPT